MLNHSKHALHIYVFFVHFLATIASRSSCTNIKSGYFNPCSDSIRSIPGTNEINCKFGLSTISQQRYMIKFGLSNNCNRLRAV